MRTKFAHRLTATVLTAVLAANAGVASAALVTSGVANITGTWSFDFDSGVQGNFITDPGQDVFWQQMTSTTRALVPTNGASLVNLGTISFAGLTEAALQGLTYGSTPIVGNDVGNQLLFGNVFAVKTTAGNYAKVLVSAPFFDPGNNKGLIVYYETYAGAVPEPSGLVLGLAGLGLAIGGSAVARRMRTPSTQAA